MLRQAHADAGLRSTGVPIENQLSVSPQSVHARRVGYIVDRVVVERPKLGVDEVEGRMRLEFRLLLHTVGLS